MKYIIAIDGPAGAGKSTIAKLLAKRSSFQYLDSGAMYRAITFYLMKRKLLTITNNKLKKIIRKVQISFVNRKDNQLVFLNNKNVTKKIRSQTVSKFVSEISSKKMVRNEIVKRLRKFTLCNSIVMDGRDIGTNVFKDANLKIYLSASCVVRAKRRLEDLKKIGEVVPLKQLINDIQKRDYYDATRIHSPLCKGQDAVVIDSSTLSIGEVLEQINIFLPVMKT